jgi:CheY-like chemotaxis protein
MAEKSASTAALYLKMGNILNKPRSDVEKRKVEEILSGDLTLEEKKVLIERMDRKSRELAIRERFQKLLATSQDIKLREHLEAIRRETESGERTNLASTASLRVLLVDDLTYITKTVSYMLQKENFIVHVAKNGAEGIILFMNFLPDIVITDIRLPDFNGMVLVKIIRKLDENVPIIFITANDMDTDVGKELDLDIKHIDLIKNRMAYLLKPIQKEVILQTIYDMLKVSQ